MLKFGDFLQWGMKSIHIAIDETAYIELNVILLKSGRGNLSLFPSQPINDLTF